MPGPNVVVSCAEPVATDSCCTCSTVCAAFMELFCVGTHGLSLMNGVHAASGMALLSDASLYSADADADPASSVGRVESMGEVGTVGGVWYDAWSAWASSLTSGLTDVVARIGEVLLRCRF